MKDQTKDILKDVILFLVITAIAYGYFMIMFLIISFVTLSMIKLTIEMIYILSAVGTVIVDIIFVVKKVQKYRKLNKDM